MHRLRLLFLAGLVLAVGATSIAKGQDGASYKDQSQNQDRDSKHDKAKTKNDDGHRKHWWSLPHLRHKKHDSDSSARQAETKASSKTVAASPTAKTAARTNPGTKTAAPSKPGQKTVAKTGQGSKTVARSNGTMSAGTSHGKKAIGHNCTPEEAKKGNCHADKGRSAKGTTSPS